MADITFIERIQSAMSGALKGQMHLSAATGLTLTTANTYYKVVGDWVDGMSTDFTIDNANDRLVYNGPTGINAMFIGVSDVQTNIATNITYGLYKNGVLVTGAETPHGFSNQDKTATIAIATLLPLTNGDYFEVWAKAEDNNRDLTIQTLRILIKL